jgi:hypothetical protein
MRASALAAAKLELAVERRVVRSIVIGSTVVGDVMRVPCPGPLFSGAPSCIVSEPKNPERLAAGQLARKRTACRMEAMSDKIAPHIPAAARLLPHQFD